MPFDFIQMLNAGGPGAVLLGLLYGLMRYENRHLKEDIKEIKETHKDCRKYQTQELSTLHDRATRLDSRVSKVEGKLGA